LEKDGTKPGNIALMGDAKNSDFFPIQDRVSFLFHRSHGKSNKRNIVPDAFGFTIYSRKEAQLELHVEVNKTLWVIPIAKASLCDKALLCLVYISVHYLLGHDIYVQPALRQSLPFKNWHHDNYTVKGESD